MNSKLSIWLIMSCLLLGSAASGYAAGTSSSSWGQEEKKNLPVVSLYDQGVTAHKNKEFLKAKGLFEEVLRNDPNNPDALNMLAHCQLKLGMLDESLETYQKALQLRPDFPEAREYLGEAYIQAALREIETLKGYGRRAWDQLKDLENKFKEAARTL